MNLQSILYVLACLLLPILWGVIINWLFDRYDSSTRQDEGINDYQI